MYICILCIYTYIIFIKYLTLSKKKGRKMINCKKLQKTSKKKRKKRKFHDSLKHRDFKENKKTSSHCHNILNSSINLLL